MKTFLNPVASNEVSHNVALLHQVLGAFGLSVADREVNQNKAGTDTRTKVRQLQRKLGMRASRSALVDDATANAFGAALTKEGLATPERSFVVRGDVRLADGTAKRRQRLVAFDLDLRAVAAYRNVKTAAEIRKNGGFEPLGQTVSDPHGNYEITFYDWQYQRAERKKADVVVYAIGENEDEQIVGRSRLINSEDYSDTGLVNGLDVTVTETDPRTEYEIVMTALNAFLEESEVTLREIADSGEQMNFAAHELDLESTRVNIAADAERLATLNRKRLSHELLYGIGRQEIPLDWAVLHRKTDEELRAAIAASVAQRIIRPFSEREIDPFLQAARAAAVQQVLEWKKAGRPTLSEFLSTALPEEPQRRAFVTALGSFSGSDFREFWREHLPAQPEFKDRPELISRLLVTHQLSLVAGNHPALITELQADPCRKFNAAEDLLALEPSDWSAIISRTGVPDFVRGKDETEKRANYGELVQGLLNAAFPTRRIARMVEKNQLPIERTGVSRGVGNFLSSTPQFDFANSRVHDFDRQIRNVAGDDFGNVRGELMRMQRVFQCSPSPEAMAVLMEHKLDSAYSIAHIPQKTFVKKYSQALGGEGTAFAIHQRASYIATRAEMSAAHVMDYSSGVVPELVIGGAEYTEALAALANCVPNYAELFGPPDLCECEHCRSVYGAAAYFVDLLRFLWRGDLNDDGKSPLEMLKARRPDLLYLPLTCENTNTIIPYIDLANEVMEYYAIHDSLTNFQGYDTGETTAEELRANPQNFNLAAYRDRLNAAKYSFTLPYHQPLDVIRTYSDHLRVSRYEAMGAVNPLPNATEAAAIAAEALRLSPEEFRILAGAALDTTPDATPLHEYFGYTAATALEDLSGVPEFLRRSGILYTDLVELVKAQFINPHQGTLDFLEEIFSSAGITPATIYARLAQIESSTLNPAADSDIMAAINAYNAAHGTGITAGDFAQWVIDHFGEFRQVITLYEPQSKCDLTTTKLRTIQSIYQGLVTPGISNNTWSRLHRFIRLWRKLGWSIHELDLVLAALGETDITAQTIASLEFISQLHASTRLPLDRLAVLWGSIDTYGKKSLYRKLFLNKAVQRIDPAFQPDAWGNYLQSNAEFLGDHQSAILAAFRIREEDLTAILGVAKVIDAGNPRTLAPAADVLSLGNLSTIYRYVVLAKALKMRIPDFCQLTALFGPPPFSVWNVQQEKFVDIIPANTWQFHQLAEAVKKARFKAPVLQYVLQGTSPADSNLGLNRAKALQTVKAIREAFSAIEQDHADTPPSPLTAEILTAKLALTFQSDVVKRFLDIVQGSALFETMTDPNLNIAIPDPLSAKYVYVKASGRVTGAGVMTDPERATLKGLTANVHFKEAVDALYKAPEDFINDNFDGILTDLVGANAVLLDHPAQATAAALDKKLEHVYTRFIPILKGKLRRDVITQHLAALIGLSDDAAALLLAADVSALIADVSAEGFSGTYFSDAAWTTSAAQRTDATVDFSWGSAAPAALVPADNFSARWEAYLAAPASGDYTLLVDVEEADEVFRLYLDDALIIEKTGADAGTSWEVAATLNAAQMHLLRLEYAEAAQNSGVRLYWKTATTALEVIPASAAYPVAIVDLLLGQAGLFHRAAKLINGFQITATELQHFLQFSADFANIDFKALTPAHWKRMANYAALRDAVPQAQALLTDVFALANTPDPTPTVADLKASLRAATAWDEASVAFLVDTHFALGVNDFKNEIAINRLRAVLEISAGAGISAETIAQWGAPETDFDLLHDTAQLIKNTVKAKYEEEDWLELAGDLSDTIREHQKQALVAYLLTRPAIQAWGAVDADSLFEYFLIDVQMCACMDTSRIVQANAAVQMFVNRCMLNLESDIDNGLEKGVSPTAVDQDRWQWMQNYRVWEANRKVFLYPENWLEPEWRNDRSEFFKELESYLVQNDITDRSVEQAFRNYLTSLNEVANLEMCGLHQENHENGQLNFLHVFARTNNGPYKFFYRRWNEFGKWSPWEKVPVDIRSVDTAKNNGNASGVHLIPVVWKKRLFLFWPEFAFVQETEKKNSNESARSLGEKKISEMEAKKIFEIRLAWSEYVDGKWSAKQLSKEVVTADPNPVDVDDRFNLEKDLLFTPSINATTQELTITVSDYSHVYRGAFTLADIQSRIEASSKNFVTWQPDHTKHYRYHFERRKASEPHTLTLRDDTYLKNQVTHRLLPVDTMKELDITLDAPFFFSNAHRTYFVRPIDVPIIEHIRHPDLYRLPYLPYLEEDRRYIEIPHVGPDDYRPVEGYVQDYAVAFPVYPYGASEANDRLASYTAVAGGNVMGVPLARAKDIQPNATVRMMSGPSMARSKSNRPGASVGIAFYDEIAKWAIAPEVSAVLAHRTGLEFHTFHHPYSSVFIHNLNQGGLSRGNKPATYPPGLLDSDTEIASDDGSRFVTAFNPDFNLVRKASNFPYRTYYKENVCFDPLGANSQYNWELFFHAPLYIATRLSKNGKFKEAMQWFHYIFDPTTDAAPGAGESEVSRYWKVLPFKKNQVETIEEWFRNNLSANANPDAENDRIKEWRDHPFDPHLIASNRPIAYMKHVVVKYIENLIAWGDFLFRQDTRESVNESLQIYVIASHILGQRPQFVPRRGHIKAESYQSLEHKWDDFSNALVQLENIFPYSSDVTVGSPYPGNSLLGVGPAFYFCIPPNDKLLGYWDTVADRLYKIRHCQNIEGVERQLALFAPPIDPAALIQAASKGLSLGSILADLSSPPPIYRFTFLIQKANEFCGDVKALGAALLSALEKKDAEELSRLRGAHETQMLELITGIKERQVLDARATRENLEKGREAAQFRLEHYLGLLGEDSVTVPSQPQVNATLTADSQLPADTTIAEVETGADEALVESGESGLKIIPKEKEGLDKNDQAKLANVLAGAAETLAGILHLFPELDADGKPFGVGAGAAWGGQNLGAASSALGKAASTVANFLSQQAAQAVTVASYIRREQDWTLQANLAAKEIVQLDKQITSADIRIQISEKELENHRQQIENARTVELFLKDKFTNQELYQWMKEQLFAVYKQSYNLAYDMARKAEKAFQYETGSETASFIQYGYWDNAQQGLAAGEKLQLALRQLEKSHIEGNRRELELTKSISLAKLDPLALIQLRETGKCYVSVPEELFDLDFRGHYFRRIKSVRLSIPCVAGPYTSVNCSLRLLNNSVRINTTLNAGKYEHENDEGVWIDDDRFRTNRVPVSAIAASTAQNDSGLSEFNFQDGRYLPFEGSGAISDWQIELCTEKRLRQFDYTTISDVILHFNYTAREDGGPFKQKATEYLTDFILNSAELTDQPLVQLFSMKHEFPTQWHRFLHPTRGAEQVLKFTLGKDRFPFFVQDESVGIVVMKIDAFARCSKDGDYHLRVSYVNLDGDTVNSSQMTMNESEKYGGLKKAAINTTDAGVNLEELDISGEMSVKLKRSIATAFTSLAVDPDEATDLFLVVHYKLQDLG